LLQVLGVVRAVSEQATDRRQESGNGDGDGWWWVGEDGVVGVLTPDDHSLQELRLALRGECPFMSQGEEGGEDLRDSGRGPRLCNHRPIPVTDAAEGVGRALRDHQLLPGARASLFPVDLEDELPLDDVEVLVVDGMIV